MIKLISLSSLLNELTGLDAQVEQLSITLITVMITAAVICFLVSEITRNYSQVDKLWSLMPIIYSVITLIAFPSPRILIMSILVAAWGFRLSYNFYRKGGYNKIPWKGEEDYRWQIMRNNPLLKGRLRFGLFNLLFISFYQHLLILLFSTPLLLAAQYNDSVLTFTDVTAASLLLLFIVIESIADNQQFRFRKLKHLGESSDGFYNESLKKGFVVDGLWRFVRHPNFVSEQAIWVCFYLFGAAASGIWINWTLTGAILLVILFIGSTALTERISSEKYSGYTDYKKETPKFFPRLFKSN